MKTVVDETLCPLCQHANSCGVDKTTPCWCSTTTIPKEALEQIPDHLRKKVCICKKCAEKFAATKVQELK